VAIGEDELGSGLAELRLWASRLRGWLWAHPLFLGETALIVQMARLGTSDFIGTLTKAPVN
jgi:hypothetical protein